MKMKQEQSTSSSKQWQEECRDKAALGQKAQECLSNPALKQVLKGLRKSSQNRLQTCDPFDTREMTKAKLELDTVYSLRSTLKEMVEAGFEAQDKLLGGYESEQTWNGEVI